MAKYPFKDADARTGSSLRGNPLAVHHKNELDARMARHQALARQEKRALATLLTRREMRTLVRASEDARAALRAATLAAKGDAVRIAELRAAARRKLVRVFAREAPAFTQWRAMRRAQARGHRKLVDASLATLPDHLGQLQWGELGADPGIINGAEFTHPFSTFDVQSLAWSDQVIRDESFAKPAIGHLVNNFDYDNDEDTSVVAGLFGILMPAYGTSRVSCGAGFTTPVAGHVRFNAQFRNFYYRAMLSIEDSFGFSSAITSVSVDFVFTVVRGTEVITVPAPLHHVRLDSDGDDDSIVDTGVDDDVPLIATAVTQERFSANESLLVMAGAEISFYSMLDDMHCRGNALAWWQLQRLQVQMFEFPIT